MIFDLQLSYLQISIIAMIGGFLYGLALKQQVRNYFLAIFSKIAILTTFIFYLLNLKQLLFILMATALFLITFWLTILKLERC